MSEGEKFDPIAVEQQMMSTGDLPPRGDPEESKLGDTERWFTEYDDHFYALWRISMKRQLNPTLVEAMPKEDLLFLAGQTPTGYPGEGLGGIALEGNKVEANALRARSELERRAAARSAWREALALLAAAALGAGATVLGGWVFRTDPPSASDAPAAVTTTITLAVTTTTTR
jgi:hypothetical protein